jgi:hypothetical protein
MTLLRLRRDVVRLRVPSVPRSRAQSVKDRSLGLVVTQIPPP